VHGFSFLYPKGFTVTTMNEGAGEVVLLEHPKLPIAFQIFMQPFDDAMTALTPERIHRDLPDLRIENPIDSQLLGGTHVLRFSNADPSIGELREAWFIHDGLLYQITMHAGDEGVLDSWFRWLLAEFTFSAS